MIISRTPFRISFFGGGTDYPVWYEKNGGATLSTTIDKYCYLMARYYPPFFPVKYRVVWSKIEAANQHEEIEHPAVREILKHLNLRDGVEIHNIADLPARSGLGSSSSFTVGLLNALLALLGKPATKMQLALQAMHIEQNLIRENVGSQDQVAAAYGGFNKIEFGGEEKIRVHPIKISPERLKALEGRLMLFFTGLARTASEIAADWIKNTPRNGTELRAMRELVDQAVGVLSDDKRELNDFGRLLHETWQLKRKLADSIPTSRVDEIYEATRAAGAVGGKLLGAGGGGFMLLFVPPELQPRVREVLKRYLLVPFKFETGGSQIIYRQNGPSEY